MFKTQYASSPNLGSHLFTSFIFSFNSLHPSPLTQSDQLFLALFCYPQSLHLSFYELYISDTPIKLPISDSSCFFSLLLYHPLDHFYYSTFYAVYVYPRLNFFFENLFSLYYVFFSPIGYNSAEFYKSFTLLKHVIYQYIFKLPIRYPTFSFILSYKISPAFSFVFFP